MEYEGGDDENHDTEFDNDSENHDTEFENYDDVENNQEVDLEDVAAPSLDLLTEVHTVSTNELSATGQASCLKYAFMALGCSIRSFRSCIRLVLVIDGAHLKGKYRGVILIVTPVDGNNQIYPLAFGIVDKEKDNSWIWFLEHVKGCIGDISGLMNLNDKFNFRTEDVKRLYIQAATAFKKSTFRYCWNQHAGLPEVQKYLEDIGFDKWTRAYQPGLTYNQMTTNIAKSMNVVLVHGRALPEAVEQARRHGVNPINNFEYEVHNGSSKVRVNLNTRTCTYKQFDYYQIPCSHAVAVVMHRNVNIYTLRLPKYKLETLIIAYSKPVFPLGDEED
ncbi:uncharacterized protein LOC111024169 [Momordica charantia]|uniref:Uncharacterized protein LOC111024169 n=1 Tax=Momordica charantia TaxID=3673 RepID=A0A6J1DYA3_MOMCH|nr:uncharacterized protein LOC111024169 [Momordica charantia]